MTELVFLGVTNVALGFYCLHLHKKCNVLYMSAKTLTRLFVMQVEGEDCQELRTVREMIRRAKTDAMC